VLHRRTITTSASLPEIHHLIKPQGDAEGLDLDAILSAPEGLFFIRPDDNRLPIAEPISVYTLTRMFAALLLQEGEFAKLLRHALSRKGNLNVIPEQVFEGYVHAKLSTSGRLSMEPLGKRQPGHVGRISFIPNDILDYTDAADMKFKVKGVRDVGRYLKPAAKHFSTLMPSSSIRRATTLC
jgi:hypothetical protein